VTTQSLVYEGTKVRLETMAHGVKKLTLNAPATRNAFETVMMDEILHALSLLSHIKEEQEFRVLLLCGEGQVFCAGANLNEMKNQAQKSQSENKEEAQKLSRMFYALSSLPVPVICVVQGAAMGGGLGLVCCADVVIAEKNAIFSTSEVLLGIVPAVISPYLVRRVGLGKASPFMLSGKRLTAQEALFSGIVHEVCGKEDLEYSTKAIVNQFLKAGPVATRKTKELLFKASPLPNQDTLDYCAQTIADVRCTPEAQTGLGSFFNKQPPPWCKDL
jgi:methylglutaconyl-CoA hydratase